MRTLGPASLTSLAQLMAYAARADGRVSPEELETLQEFLRRRYAASSRSEFFDLFRQAVERRPDLERIVDEIHLGLPDYQDRLEVYATIQTLLVATDLKSEESGALGKIASLLEIHSEDADLLAQATRRVPDFRFPKNRERCLRIGADPGDAAAGRAVRFVAVSVAGAFAVSSDHAEVVAGDVAYPPGEIVFVRPLDQLKMPAATLSFADLSRLFDLASRRTSRVCLLRAVGDRLVTATGPAASLELRVSAERLHLLRRDPAQTVYLNGHLLDGGAMVLPGDILGFDGGEIKVCDLLDALDNTTWPLSRSASAPMRCVISDQPGDLPRHVLADVAGALSITISESHDAASPLLVVCDACQCQVPVRLGNTPLRAGARTLVSEPTTLQVGHHWFVIDPLQLKVDYSRRVVERFEARDLEYRFKSTIGLHDITFAARGGELVGIMGASGSGKSTLLGVLLGVLNPHKGAVLLNGEPLQLQLQRRRSILGYVPQDDLVIDNLTVEENVRYAGRIRCPDLPDVDLRRRVTRVLRDVGLADKQGLRVGNPVRKVLSGGQRKRLNIAIELVADPELFLLDEPTSGLSSQDSKAIVGLLSQLTRRGKLVFAVIHQPSSDIYKAFDKLLLLDAGGVMAWYGPTRDAIRHFKAFLPGHRDFVECPACGSVNPEGMLDAIEQPLAAASEPSARKFDPPFWANAFLLSAAGRSEPTGPASLLPARPAMGWRGKGRALAASVERAFVTRARDRTNIVMSVAAPVVLGVAMASMLRGPDEPYTYSGNPALAKFFFLSTIVFVFFGLMASVNEVIAEAALINRERVASFKASQYVAAKTLAFLPFSLLQVVIYAVLAGVILHFPYRAPGDLPIQPRLPFPWHFGIVLFLVAQASFALGLLVSSFLRTQAAAFNWIPLIVIPQILLGGVFVDFAELPKIVNRVVPEYAELTFSRWGYEALLAGEKDFNPSDHLNADSILALRQQFQERGQPFDTDALVAAPRARWRNTPAFDLPPRRISSRVMQDTLLYRLRLNDQTADADLLEHAYQRVDRHSYVIRGDLPAGTAARVAGILMSPAAGSWASTFAAESVNATLESARQEANVAAPPASPLRELLTDRSDFPARAREIGGAAVPVALWNCLVLVVMIVSCHATSIVRLRRP